MKAREKGTNDQVVDFFQVFEARSAPYKGRKLLEVRPIRPDGVCGGVSLGLEVLQERGYGPGEVPPSHLAASGERASHGRLAEGLERQQGPLREGEPPLR